MKIFDWFKKPPKKDMSDFPTKEERIARAKIRILNLKKRIRQLQETEGNPEKRQELQAALAIKKTELKQLEG
jgi:hypothetical protein